MLDHHVEEQQGPKLEEARSLMAGSLNVGAGTFLPPQDQAEQIVGAPHQVDEPEAAHRTAKDWMQAEQAQRRDREGDHGAVPDPEALQVGP